MSFTWFISLTFAEDRNRGLAPSYKTFDGLCVSRILTLAKGKILGDI